MNIRLKSLVAAALVAAASAAAPARPQQPAASEPLGGDHVLYATGHGIGCRAATVVETQALERRDGGPLRIIKSQRAGKLAGETGLTIVLRGTAQLDSFPAARQAFINAAAEWESRVGTPITIVLDVDFGPTRFGTPYPPFVIGSTSSQFPGLSRAIPYSTLRSRIIERAPTEARGAIYSALPAGASVPTTEGDGGLVYIATAPMRALGFLNPDADPEAEAFLGNPPSIGFNSAFDYDFDQANGISSNLTDFTGAAIHEIGHALGFVSFAGNRELNRSAPVLLTTWDLFRFRPGVNLGTFGAAQRVTVSGGEQIFFAGGSNLRLSTGRPDASGGDGNQASHWKDDAQNNRVRIGVMDPTIDFGEKFVITQNDVDALAFIGYQIGKSTFVSGLDAVVDGDDVTVTGSLSDPDGDLNISSLRFDVLDRSNAVLGQLEKVDVDSAPGDPGSLGFTASLRGLSAIANAALVRVFVTDGLGNITRVVADLGLADAGGPSLEKVTFKNNKLKLGGTGFTSTVTLEVNGEARTVTIKANRQGTKLTIKADAATLGLAPAPAVNKIRVLSDGLRSNVVRFTL